MKKQWGIFWLCCLLFSACQVQSREKVSDMRIGTPYIALTLDTLQEEAQAASLRYGIGETLFRFDEHQQAQAWLAESLTRSFDGEWHLRLREDVYFSNGERLTGRMVVKNLQRIAGLHPQDPIFVGADFEAYGQEVILRLANKRSDLAEVLCAPYSIMWDLDASKDLQKAPVGTGPYQVKDFVLGQKIELVANLRYWKETPLLTSVTIQKIPEQEALAALKAKRIDAYSGLSTIKEEDLENYKWKKYDALYSYVLYYKFATMSDYLLRDAVDRSLRESSFDQYGFLAREDIFPWMQEACLASATQSVDQNSFYQDKQGGPLLLRIAYEKSTLYGEEMAKKVAEALARIGIQSSLVAKRDSYGLWDDDYDLGIHLTSSFAKEDILGYFEALSSERGEENFTGIRDDRLDICRQEIREAEDATTKRDYINAFAQQLQAAHYVTFIGHLDSYLIYDSAYTGFANYPQGYYLLNR